MYGLSVACSASNAERTGEGSESTCARQRRCTSERRTRIRRIEQDHPPARVFDVGDDTLDARKGDSGAVGSVGPSKPERTSRPRSAGACIAAPRRWRREAARRRRMRCDPAPSCRGGQAERATSSTSRRLSSRHQRERSALSKPVCRDAERRTSASRNSPARNFVLRVSCRAAVLFDGAP